MATKLICDRCGAEINPKSSVIYAGTRRFKMEINDDDCDHCGAIKLAERYDCSFSYTLPYGWGEFGRNHLCPSCYTAWGNLKNQAESEGDNG